MEPATIYKLRKNSAEKPSSQDRVRIPKNLIKYKGHIDKRLKKDKITNIRKLCDELRVKGYIGHDSTVYRYVNALEENKRSKEYKRSTRYETGPGEQAQVDWASFGKITLNGNEEPLYAFVYILGYSRMKYVEFTIRQNLQTLQNCHIHAFQQLGIPQAILYDNMKTIVLKRDRKNNLEPSHNPKFQDFAHFYGFKVHLSHLYYPRDKGKVEATIKLLRNDFMDGMRYGRDFFSMRDLNEKVKYWLNAEANKRIHMTTEERPFIRFEREKKYLRFPNGVRPYETSLWATRWVTKYGMVYYKYNSYSVQDGFARKKVIINERSENGLAILDIYYKTTLIATHELASGRNRWIQDEKHFKNVDNVHKVNRKVQKENEKLLHAPVDSKPLTYYDRYLER